MRLYTFTHYMLSPMAKGIQATHATVELFNKYTDDEGDFLGQILYSWSIDHKTMISLDGGVSPDLDLLVEYFQNADLELPWAYFKEDESLGELVTAVAVVVPERIYETAEALRKGEIQWDDEVKKFKATEFRLDDIVPHKYMNDREVEFTFKLMNYRMAK